MLSDDMSRDIEQLKTRSGGETHDVSVRLDGNPFLPFPAAAPANDPR